MAKKTTTTKRTTVERRERRDLTKICAFWGILLSGVAMFIGFIISLLQLVGVTISWANTLRGICSMVSMIALLIAVAILEDSLLGSACCLHMRHNRYRIYSLIQQKCGARKRPVFFYTQHKSFRRRALSSFKSHRRSFFTLQNAAVLL